MPTDVYTDLTGRVCEGYKSQVDSFGYRTLARFDWIYMFSHDLDSGLNLVSKERFFCYVSGLPFSLVLFCQQVIRDLEDFRAFICFLFSPALSNWFVHFVWNC